MFALAKLKLYGAVLLGLLLSFLGIFLKGKAVGVKKEEIKVLKEKIQEEVQKNEVVKKTSEVAIDVARLPDTDVRQRLQDSWSRD